MKREQRMKQLIESVLAHDSDGATPRRVALDIGISTSYAAKLLKRAVEMKLVYCLTSRNRNTYRIIPFIMLEDGRVFSAYYEFLYAWRKYVLDGDVYELSECVSRVKKEFATMNPLLLHAAYCKGYLGRKSCE